MTRGLLDFRHVSVMLGGKRVLDDITLTIGAGEHVAILGPNGCGKSTLIKTITRECYPLAEPESSLTILGRETWNVFELRPLLGIVSSELMRALHAGDHRPRDGALRVLQQHRGSALSRSHQRR